MKKPLTWLMWVAVAAIFAVSVWKMVDTRRERAEMAALRGQIQAARISADSCVADLERDQERFRSFGARVDTLRMAVRAYEDPELGGVPQEEYAEYLERFDGYNDSVATWETRADELRASEAACRALVEAHNVLSDSLRRRIFPDSSPRQDTP